MKKMSKNLKSEWSLKKPFLLDKKDKRYARHSKQLKEHGFSDSETWSLDSTICKFILPRLKRFKEINNGYPAGMKSKEWDSILDKMIFAFEFEMLKYDWDQNDSKFDSNYAKCREGLKLFAEWFEHLWW